MKFGMMRNRKRCVTLPPRAIENWNAREVKAGIMIGAW